MFTRRLDPTWMNTRSTPGQRDDKQSRPCAANPVGRPGGIYDNETMPKFLIKVDALITPLLTLLCDSFPHIAALPRFVGLAPPH